MLLAVLFALAAIATAVGALVGLIYPFKCRALDRHIDSSCPAYEEDEEGFRAWYQKRWRLDMIRRHTALWGVGAYIVALFSVIPVKSMLDKAGSTSHVPMIMILVITGALWIILVCSAIHDSRELALDLKRR